MSNFGNFLKSGLIFAALTGLVLGVAFLFGGTQILPFALILAAVMNLAGWYFSATMAIMAMRAQEVGPDHELYRIVEPLAQKAGLPMPRVYISPYAAPNAFATGRSYKHSAVCATAGLMQMLNRDEIAGVMAHELAHVKHRDVLLQSLAATVSGALTMLGYMFMFGGGDDEDAPNPLFGLLILILGPIAAGILQMALSRSREFAADTEAANITGRPEALASALQKVHYGASQVPMDVNPAMNALMIAEPRNLRSTMANLFSTHPPLEARLENLLGYVPAPPRMTRRPSFF